MKGFIFKSPSILKKFLLINLVIFVIIGLFTIFYLKSIQPNLIKNKSVNHIKIINNTVDHINRLNINFEKKEINTFLLSIRFLFQNLDRVQFFDNEFQLIGDTDTLDLDPRSFSRNLAITEQTIGLSEKKDENILNVDGNDNKDKFRIIDIAKEYESSKNFGKPITLAKQYNNNFNVFTIKNVIKNEENVGFIIISESSNEIRTAINERKNFILRTVFIAGLVLFVFSFVLNKYFLKPIKNLVDYTKSIKEKETSYYNLKKFIKRKDEIGQLSNSLNEMTEDLYKRINIAETFSSDLVHEIRNPLASLKSASEIIGETEDSAKRLKLIKIISHDVERIERLITDYSQMLKDEAALSREKMKKINIVSIVRSVVDDFNNISNSKNNVKVKLNIVSSNKSEIFILGLENRIEQILANLLDNSISFSPPNSEIIVSIIKEKKNVKMTVEDQGFGFKEKNTNKIFERFYSNRPEKFGEHSGLGLNIVRNLVEVHGGSIIASNRLSGKGAKVDINFPELLVN